MGSYRCLATWPYMAEMHPAKRSTTTLPTPQPSTPELPRPVADVGVARTAPEERERFWLNTPVTAVDITHAPGHRRPRR